MKRIILCLLWMAKKAIEKMTTGGYVDVYAICTTPRN